MPTVTQAAKIVSASMNVPLPTVKAIARQMIDDTILPKSSGRRVEKITIRQTTMLIVASLASEKIKEASSVAKTYDRLLYDSYDKKKHGDDTCAFEAGAYFASGLRSYISIGVRPSSTEWRGSVSINTVYPEINFNFFGGYLEGSSREIRGTTARFFENDRKDDDLISYFPAKTIRIPNSSFAALSFLWRRADSGTLDEMLDSNWLEDFQRRMSECQEENNRGITNKYYG